MIHQFSLRFQALPTRVRLLQKGETWPVLPERLPAPPSVNTSPMLSAPQTPPAGLEEFAQLTNRIQQALTEVENKLREQREAWRQAAIELATVLASHFLQQQVEQGHFPWPDLVHEMIQSLEGATVRVRLNPDDWSAWQSHAPSAIRFQEIAVVEDPRLRRGECLVETDTEVRWHSLAERMRAIREVLLRDWSRDPI
jgi:flagellar biosynthesis/type III secretory pathway protein FliH